MYTIRIENMRVQGLNNPVGLGTKNPILSYNLKSTEYHEKKQWQSAYRILVASDIKLLEQDIGDLWDSGICRQNWCFGIEYSMPFYVLIT